jgi:hypothetical protein
MDSDGHHFICGWFAVPPSYYTLVWNHDTSLSLELAKRESLLYSSDAKQTNHPVLLHQDLGCFILLPPQIWRWEYDQKRLF